jgi:Holliday junction resolvase RusA-like endonuclease
MKKMLELKMMEFDNRFDVAVSVSLTFWLRRPKTVTRQYATQTYDLDKLTRAVFDSLTQSGVIKDDSYVVDLTARKNYNDLHEPGVLISLTPFDNSFITAGVSELDRKRRGLV